MLLLAEEDTINETKSQNQMLLDFLRKQENIEELIQIALTEPPDSGDNNRKFKYFTY